MATCDLWRDLSTHGVTARVARRASAHRAARDDDDRVAARAAASAASIAASSSSAAAAHAHATCHGTCSTVNARSVILYPLFIIKII